MLRTQLLIAEPLRDLARDSHCSQADCPVISSADQTAKIEQETEAEGPQTLSAFLPTAWSIREAFHRPPISESQQQKDPISGKYKRPSMQRLTPLERRKVRNFEKHMRKATEGRRLFMTESGLFGLGPKSLGQDSNSKDEVWILMGHECPLFCGKSRGIDI
jgi:hypothetical protein